MFVNFAIKIYTLSYLLHSRCHCRYIPGRGATSNALESQIAQESAVAYLDHFRC
jgi:hypothetical protein